MWPNHVKYNTKYYWTTRKLEFERGFDTKVFIHTSVQRLFDKYANDNIIFYYCYNITALRREPASFLNVSVSFIYKSLKVNVK